MVEHGLLYDRAQEHLKICLALWDSVEPGAIAIDRPKGVFGDPFMVHCQQCARHKGGLLSYRPDIRALHGSSRACVAVSALKKMGNSAA
jgi:hypothetical protein